MRKLHQESREKSGHSSHSVQERLLQLEKQLSGLDLIGGGLASLSNHGHENDPSIGLPRHPHQEQQEDGSF